MPFLGERERTEVGKILQSMVGPVRIVNFTQTFECETCRDTRALLEELVSVDDRLSLEVFNFAIDKEKAAEYGVDKVPATVVEGAGGARLRFYGPPEGYEFSSLLDAIILVSKGDSALDPQSRSMLGAIDKPLHLEVLVTPT